MQAVKTAKALKVLLDYQKILNSHDLRDYK